jgi:hypothetical protein
MNLSNLNKNTLKIDDMEDKILAIICFVFVVAGVLTLLMSIMPKQVLKIVSIFNKIKPTGRVLYPNSILRIANWKDRKIYGFTASPEIGDEIRFEMSSGKIFRCLVKKVEWCRGPDDMYFADLVDIGYLVD